MRLLIFGASGQTGQTLVRQAIADGHTVTAFVRQPAKLSDVASFISIVQGTVADAAAVAAVVPGHDAVISTLGTGQPLKPDPDVVTGLNHIVRSMQAHQVRRLIYLSFAGVRASRSRLGFVLRYIAPIPLRHEIADHESREAMVIASDPDWTIVRPPKLTSGPRTGRYRAGERIRTWKPVALLSRADVADFILGELARPQYIRQAPLLLA